MENIEAIWESLTRESPLARGRPSGGGETFRAWWRRLVHWPPDIFALTSVVLEDSGSYRHVVDPETPAFRRDNDTWSEDAFRLAYHWKRWYLKKQRMPRRLRELGDLIAAERHRLLTDLERRDMGHLIEALVEVHAAADEACASFGIPKRGGQAEEEQVDDAVFVVHANLRIKQRNPTVSRLNPSVVRVLPKMRTPQLGMTIRGLSHNLCVVRSEVDIRWFSAPTASGRPGFAGLNVLLVPWPLTLSPGDFRETETRLPSMDDRIFGFFEFQPVPRPGVATVVEFVERALALGSKRLGHIDGVILPECAITDDELLALEEVMVAHGHRQSPPGTECAHVPFILAGVRGSRRNQAVLAYHDNGVWRGPKQDKHHRWQLNESQIRNYHLGGVLHPAKRWWEDIELPTRSLNFACVNGWMTVCPRICEDLARPDPVAPVIRAVGPTLIVALLLDGPQLASRWPGQYAATLADDPGSSVLTLSALGMVERSRPPRMPVSRVVGLWKDATGETRELTLAADANALILSVNAVFEEEFTSDGRSDGQAAAHIVFGGLEQLTVPCSVEPRDPPAPSPPPAPAPAPTD